MSREKIGFFLNFLLLTLFLTFAIEYFFPSSPPDSDNQMESKIPTDLATIDSKPVNKDLFAYQFEKQTLYFNKDTGNLEKLSLSDYQDKDNDLIEYFGNTLNAFLSSMSFKFM